MRSAQLPLLPFDGLPRARTETSYRAAVKATPKAASKRDLIVAALRQAGDRGMTAPELVDALRLPLGTIHPRLGELRRDGLAWEEHGRTRKNRYGNDCQVWRLTHKKGG